MFLSRTLPLARAAPAWASSLTAAPKRRMGGLTNVKKNYWVEEWNGKREITEKTFELNGKSLTKIFVWIVLFPVFIHSVVKDELDNSHNNCINPVTKKPGTA